jgi:transcription initiation factor TFIID subunit 5
MLSLVLRYFTVLPFVGPQCVKFHPNSLYLATGSSDRTCRLWDVQKGTCVRVFAGHSGAVSTVAISPDGRYLASAGEDTNVNLWDLGTSRLIKSMQGHTGKVHSLSFGAESSVLVSGSADCTVRVWDVLTARTTPTSVQSAASSGGGRDGGTERPSSESNT